MKSLRPLGSRRPRGGSQLWTSNEIDAQAAPTEQQRERYRDRIEEEHPALADLLDAPTKKPADA